MQPQQIELKATDDDLKGRFSNLAQVSHQQDHFLLDFFMLAPPAGQLVGRIAMSPGHMKALKDAIDDQLKKYEASFGKVKATEQKKEIGFDVRQ